MSTDQIEQAVIGFGSAIIGAIVGGLFVLYAARGQWRRDKRETSRQAARRVLAALVPLEGVFATLLAGQSIPNAEAAATLNTFSAATTTELPFITDDQVCARVLAHVQLCWPLLLFQITASAPPPPRDVYQAVRRHANAVVEALEAHIRERPLPRYVPLPQNASGAPDLSALVSWPSNG